jgi:hypothetical protein
MARKAEHGKGGDHRHQADGRHAARRRHHVLLGDAELDEAVRVAFAEVMHAGAAGNIGVQHHQLGKLVGQCRQRLAEGFAQGIAVGGNQGRARHRAGP